MRNTKQVIVMRRDLKMRRGKEIAQGSHASMAFLTHNLKKCLEEQTDLSEAAVDWLASSFRKITCKVDSEEALISVFDAARAAGLEVHLITDSGATEFHGVPTRTCLAIGPDYDDVIDAVTKDLVLY